MIFGVHIVPGTPFTAVYDTKVVHGAGNYDSYGQYDDRPVILVLECVDDSIHKTYLSIAGEEPAA